MRIDCARQKGPHRKQISVDKRCRRITYQMYLHNKKGFARYVPVDMFQSQQLVSRAKHMYMHMYKNFNKSVLPTSPATQAEEKKN